MHTLKLVFLVTLTLAVMRSVSWGIAWPLIRWRPRRRRAILVASNLAALGLFLGYLYLDRLPGELLDATAAVVGAVVYTVFALVDLVWYPWARKVVPANDAAA